MKRIPKADELRAKVDAMAEAGKTASPPMVANRGPVITCLADVESRPVSWLWPGRIPLGRITLLVGRPGEGKSLLTTYVTARVTTGTRWPDGGVCPKGSVLLISAEDDPSDTIRPRLDAHGADVAKVHLLSAMSLVENEEHHQRLVTLADLDVIEATLVQLPDCRLVVVDPVGSYIGGRTDAHRDNEVRAVLAPIAALAEKYGLAVLVVAHRRKSPGNNADDTALGSRAFTGIARAVWHLTRDAGAKSRRLFLPGKNNLAREGTGLAFSIIGEPPHVSWEPDPVAMSADDALAAESEKREQKPGPDAEAVKAAKTWLCTVLASGPRLFNEVLDEWKNGQGGSKRTLDRAKQALQVEAYHPQVPGPWWWRLPANNAKPTEK
jgi:putative DNA primase/helicase